jgi:hypothetical protein
MLDSEAIAGAEYFVDLLLPHNCSIAGIILWIVYRLPILLVIAIDHQLNMRSRTFDVPYLSREWRRSIKYPSHPTNNLADGLIVTCVCLLQSSIAREQQPEDVEQRSIRRAYGQAEALRAPHQRSLRVKVSNAIERSVVFLARWSFILITRFTLAWYDMRVVYEWLFQQCKARPKDKIDIAWGLSSFITAIVFYLVYFEGLETTVPNWARILG